MERGTNRKLKLTKEIFAYLIVGVLTTIIGLAVYYGLTFTVLDADDPLQLQIANMLMWIIAVTFAYVTNRKFVFESKNKNIIREALSFYGARVVTLLVDMGFMFLFVSLMHFDDRVVKLIVQVIVMVLNYVFSKLLVFRRSGL